MAEAKDFLINLSRLARPLSNVKNIALIVLALYFSKSGFNLILLLAGVLSLSFECSAFYAYNTLSDYDSDKNNKNKEHYSGAIDYFGKKNSFLIFILLLSAGVIIGLFINLYFLICLALLALANFFYSSKRFRFKERFILDILFGAFFTFLFRFLACWFMLSNLSPPLLLISVLVFAKSAGYLLYKSLDYNYLLLAGIKNSAAVLSKKAKIIASAVLWTLALLCLLLLKTDIYIKIAVIFFALPPILVMYLSFLDKIKAKVKNLRIWGFVYWILAMAAILSLMFFDIQ